MQLHFTTQAPLGTDHHKILDAISKELRLIQSKVHLGLGPLKMHTGEGDHELNFSCEPTELGPEITGKISVDVNAIVTFEIEVPDCNPFRMIIGQTFLGSFHEIKIPLDATV